MRTILLKSIRRRYNWYWRNDVLVVFDRHLDCVDAFDSVQSFLRAHLLREGRFCDLYAYERWRAEREGKLVIQFDNSAVSQY